MKERPILFSGPMVRALVAGTKTQTRRLCKEPGAAPPYGAPGDRLWVKETWAAPHAADHLKPSEVPRDQPIRYAADGDLGDWRARPSLFMPRWASRITLEVTAVRVERLQAIGVDDAHAEGVAHATPGTPGVDAVSAYRAVWETIHGPRAWEADPWVWVVSFRPAPVGVSAASAAQPR